MTNLIWEVSVAQVKCVSEEEKRMSWIRRHNRKICLTDLLVFALVQADETFAEVFACRLVVLSA